MRLSSQIFVSALMRQAEIEMGFATILKKGAAEGGAVYVLHRKPDRMLDLYGPAMQSSYGDANSDDRRFELRLSTDNLEDIYIWTAKEGRFDADFWLVEIELPSRHFHSMLQLAEDK